MDHLTPQQRSRNMAVIRNKDTKPEIARVLAIKTREDFTPKAFGLKM